MDKNTRLLDLLVFCSGLQDGRHVVRKAQLLKSLCDVIAGNCLLGLFLADLVGLGRNQSDELDTAFYEQVSSFFREGHAGGAWQNLAHDLLNRGCEAWVSIGTSVDSGSPTESHTREGSFEG